MGDLVFICVLLVYLRQQIVGPSAKRVTTNHERSTIGRAERGSWRPLRPCNGGTREARRRGHFFRCYHSEELPVLIDMSLPSLIKIPEGSPGALPSALGCLFHPGPSFPVARGKPGVLQSRTSKVENGISSSPNRPHVRFSRGTWTVSRIARPPGHRLTPDRFHPLRKSSLCIANIFFGTSHFPNFLKL